MKAKVLALRLNKRIPLIPHNLNVKLSVYLEEVAPYWGRAWAPAKSKPKTADVVKGFIFVVWRWVVLFWVSLLASLACYSTATDNLAMGCWVLLYTHMPSFTVAKIFSLLALFYFSRGLLLQNTFLPLATFCASSEKKMLKKARGCDILTWCAQYR